MYGLVFPDATSDPRNDSASTHVVADRRTKQIAAVATKRPPRLRIVAILNIVLYTIVGCRLLLLLLDGVLKKQFDDRSLEVGEEVMFSWNTFRF